MVRRDNKVSKSALAAALSGALLASSCVLMPHDRPEAGVLPDTWRDAPVVADANGTDRLVNWWQGFNDPTLNALVAQGVSDGPTVQLAALRLREARSLSYATLVRYFPAVSAIGSESYRRAVEGPLLPNASGGLDEEQSTVSWGGQASWEVPLFSIGATATGVRGANRAAFADARGALVAIAADIANAYVDLRAAQRSYAALQEAVANADRIASILQTAAQAGFASEADAADARRQAETQRAALSNYFIAMRRAEATLSVLRGIAPGAEAQDTATALESAADVPSLPIASAPAAPVDLVRLRPDVAAAEAQALIAAAQLGAARADLLPKLNITGAINVTDNDIGTPLGTSTTLVTAQPIISLPLFDWGQRIATVSQRDAQFHQSLIQYRLTVIQAVADATTALVSLDQGSRQLTASRAASEAAETTLRGRRAAYNAGLLSLTDLLRAEQQAIDARLSLIAAQQSQARAAVAVYRAFGGGPPEAVAQIAQAAAPAAPATANP